LMRVWERALRRAGVPLAYSHGFNPRPKLQLAAALPLGHTGEAELLDVWLERSVTVDEFVRSLVPMLPDGLRVGQVRRVSLREPALQTQVVSAEYRVTVERDEPVEQVATRLESALAAEELLHERAHRRRAGERYDLRPLIERLEVEGAARGEVVLGMQLAAREGATARPEAVLEALGMGDALARYHRRRLICEAAA